MRMPDEPDNDPITMYLIDVYRRVSKARRYLVGGNKGIPLPLTVRDITDWVDAHPTPLSREELDQAIFSLDWIEREELAQD